jgi:hypothetical protein
MPKLGMKVLGAKNRDLKVLTRNQGVRTENPLMTVGDYYPPSHIRTPALRQEADQVLDNYNKAKRLRGK